ncbi:hypothetical protein LK12_22690 [Novosphingobium malaysiense]|uniref:Short-chain dehydrogenase n=2 Tax=Novosphingobium malaysiense TaxID=1348853 RepID=A0A0B1ZEW1_9SPHN|nr:hypothetical protein LK12_22690 [Novosphingobium malaysiense]
MRLPPVLRGGFRPFFLGGAAWAVIALALWLATLFGIMTLPSAFDPLAWHRHEMLFGYLGAVIAGFLLTAVPNWTGRLPIAGGRLAALAGLWLAARLGMLFSAEVGGLTACALDVGFLAVLTFMIGREILAAKNRNVPILVAMSLFTLADALDQIEALGGVVLGGLGWRMGFAIVLLLIALIGGRIIPSFTRNWLSKQGVKAGLPTQPGRFDYFTIGITALALVGWAFASQSPLSGGLLVIAGTLQFVRLARWSGLKAFREPLVLILHVSFLWLPLGLMLTGSSLFLPYIPFSASLHLLSAGAMASMTLAVMTRATLGHTGHALRANRSTQAIFVLMTLGALARFAAPMMPFDYMLGLLVAGVLWAGAFLLFVIAYASKLIGPRPDGKP